jgi:hypothetical protein
VIKLQWWEDPQNIGIIISAVLGILALIFSGITYWNNRKLRQIQQESTRVSTLENFPQLIPIIKEIKEDEIEYIIKNNGNLDAINWSIQVNVYKENDPKKGLIGSTSPFVPESEYGIGHLPAHDEVRFRTDQVRLLAMDIDGGKVTFRLKVEDTKKILESKQFKLVILRAIDITQEHYCSCRYFLNNRALPDIKFLELEKRKKNYDEKTKTCKYCRMFQLKSKELRQAIKAIEQLSKKK